MAKKNSGQGMFAALTDDETWILSTKLMAGEAAFARAGDGDHETVMELLGVIGDVQANFNRPGK